MVKTKKMDDVSEHVAVAKDPIPVSGNPNLLAENDVANGDLTIETPASEIIQTLPDSFNSLIGESIDIDTDHAQELIGILGEKLGIEDYRTNLAAFWLLDAMALEVTRIKHEMNSVNLAVFISWIAGEARLIQVNQFTRREFFQKMHLIFGQMSEQLGKGRPMPYWEEIVGVELSPKNRSASETDREEEEAEFIPNLEQGHSSNQILSQESDTDLANPIDVLEAIIESTYVMYANAFHYETVSAAFARPVELRSYQLPYTLRLPRPVEKAVLPSVNQPANDRARGKPRLKPEKGKNGRSKGTEKTKSKTPAEVPQLPPTADEQVVAEKRKHILPLMESNEAARILEQYSHPPSINLVSESKREYKAKRKA